MDLHSIRKLKCIKTLVAESGMTFTNVFVSDPFCCPSRTSILTGRYIHNHRVIHNNAGGGYKAFVSSQDSMVATWLIAQDTAWAQRLRHHKSTSGLGQMVWVDGQLVRRSPQPYWRLNENGREVRYRSENLHKTISWHARLWSSCVDLRRHPSFCFSPPTLPTALTAWLGVIETLSP